ncbi:MAG: efflux RND transporter permease subunit, partial [Spirochaetaceae bacterium]
MKKLIEYFSEKHILTNLFVVATLIGAVYFWNSTRKEELPNIDYDVVRVSAYYPGATAENMDSLVTRNIENALDGIDGIISVSSTSGLGSASLSVELDPGSPERSHVVSDISDAVAAVDYPDAMDLPRVMEFKSSRFSVLDLAISYTGVDVMSDEQREKLQNVTDMLADRIKRVSGVSEVGYNAYMDKFVEINVRPEKLVYFDITLSEITSALKKSIINQPIGALSDQALTKIKLESEVTDPAQLGNIIIRSNFEGNMIRLKDLASVESKFENRNNIYKVDGNEAVVLRVTKSSGSGIIEVVDRINSVTDEFAKTMLVGNGIMLRTLEDQSTGVRNRLSIISSNGLMGFILVVLVLFALLDAKSSFWVGMSIPFTMAATMIIAPLFGQTINNMTLAAVIIVMGMIVDNGIVVAENAARLAHSGLSLHRSVVQGTSEVVSPIVASIATTCVAFIPLYFFQGRYGALAAFLPPVIFIMLG